MSRSVIRFKKILKLGGRPVSLYPIPYRRRIGTPRGYSFVSPKALSLSTWNFLGIFKNKFCFLWRPFKNFCNAGAVTRNHIWEALCDDSVFSMELEWGQHYYWIWAQQTCQTMPWWIYPKSHIDYLAEAHQGIQNRGASLVLFLVYWAWFINLSSPKRRDSSLITKNIGIGILFWQRRIQVRRIGAA